MSTSPKLRFGQHGLSHSAPEEKSRLGTILAGLASMKNVFVSLGFLIAVALSAWAGTAWNTMQVKARTTQTVVRNQKFNDEVENLFSALQKYRERVGSFPVGGNAEVGRALQGVNPKNVIVIVGGKMDVNEKGEFVDPWGTALKIYFSDNGMLIRSAGPNRRFDDNTAPDADDLFRSN
jgi:hypothetical protein